MKITKMDQLMNQVMNQVMQQSMDQVKSGFIQKAMGVKLTPQQEQMIERLQVRVAELCKRGFSWDVLEPEYAKLYADTYTEQELDEIIAFDKSPTGQAVITKNPEILKQSSVIAQARMSALTPELQQIMKDFMAEATKTPQDQKQEH